MMNIPSGHLVGGRWIKDDDAPIPVIDPTTEEVIGFTPSGDANIVAQACIAASDAFDSWSRTPAAVRGQALHEIATAMQAQRTELAELITAEVGVPVSGAGPVQVDLAVSILRYYADLATSVAFEERLGSSMIVRQPVGVVAAITPWNYPLYQIVSKIGPAIAAGCTVVLKPSEIAPLNTSLLAQIVMGTGIPDGVLNIVFGTGEIAGDSLVRDPRIDMVSFTGSTRGGREVSLAAAERVLPVSLELGGKSAALVLRGGSLEAAVADTLGMCYANSGQNCGALSRLIVPADLAEEAVDLAIAAASGFTVGDPRLESTSLGPLVSAVQLERVRGFIATGVQEGARLVVGDSASDYKSGYFVGPHVFADVTADMAIAQEEIFGPVLSIISYSGDEDEGVALVNGTDYGLCGAVWGPDDRSAYGVARRIRAGQVDINGAPYNGLAPFGGFGLSGHGRELGPLGIEEFLAPQALQFHDVPFMDFP